jgi:hypothetical protein
VCNIPATHCEQPAKSIRADSPCRHCDCDTGEQYEQILPPRNRRIECSFDPSLRCVVDGVEVGVGRVNVLAWKSNC